MSYLKNGLLWTLCFGMFGSHASGQAAKVAPAEDQVLQLAVVVAPKTGLAADGLKIADFTLTDNGVPRKIESVREVQGALAPVQIVLVVDAVNASAVTVGYERGRIKNYLLADGGHLKHPTSLAVMTEQGMKLQQHPSLDGIALNATLEQDVIGLRAVRRSAGFYGAQERLDDSLKSLESLLNALQSEPGRKLVIFVSPGWPLLSGSEVNLTTQQQAGIFRSIMVSSAAIRRANVTLYDVNPVGVGENLLRANYFRAFLKGQVDSQHVELGDLGLQVLAAQSGGLVDESTNGIAEAIARDAADADHYYELTFMPTTGEVQPAYHGLEVRVAGQIGRTRTSYYTAGGGC